MLVEDYSPTRGAVLVVRAPAANESRGAVCIFNVRYPGSVGAAFFGFRQRITAKSSRDA